MTPLNALQKRQYEHDLLKHIQVDQPYDINNIPFSMVLQIINVTFEINK